MVSAISSSVSSHSGRKEQPPADQQQQQPTAYSTLSPPLEPSYELQRNVSETHSSSQAARVQQRYISTETRQLAERPCYTQQVTRTVQQTTAAAAESPMAAFGADAYHSETRKVSSVVLESTILGDQPDMQDRVRYVEVPTFEEQITYKTVHEKREVEKRVPKYEIEYVDRVVEVPKTVYIDVPNEEKIIVERRIEKEVPYEVYRIREVKREVKVRRPRYVEQIREVPGDVIEVPKYVDKPHYVETTTYKDNEVPVVVAQTIKPIITESGRSLAVDVLDYEPEVTPINVHIAKPVSSALEVVGQRDVRHRLVTITSGQYNTILRQLNKHMDVRTQQSLPFVAEHGRVAFVPEQEAHFIVAPANIQIEGWQGASTTVVQSRQVAPSVASHTNLESQHANRAACCDARLTKRVETTQVMQRGAPSSSYQQTSVQQQHQMLGGQEHVSVMEASQHMQTEGSGIYTETAGDEEVRQDGSTVLSQRPQQRSRVCC